MTMPLLSRTCSNVSIKKIGDEQDEALRDRVHVTPTRFLGRPRARVWVPHGSWVESKPQARSGSRTVLGSAPVVHGRGAARARFLGKRPCPLRRLVPHGAICPRMIKHVLPWLCNCARHTRDMFDNRLRQQPFGSEARVQWAEREREI